MYNDHFSAQVVSGQANATTNWTITATSANNSVPSKTIQSTAVNQGIIFFNIDTSVLYPDHAYIFVATGKANGQDVDICLSSAVTIQANPAIPTPTLPITPTITPNPNSCKKLGAVCYTNADCSDGTPACQNIVCNAPDLTNGTQYCVPSGSATSLFPSSLSPTPIAPPFPCATFDSATKECKSIATAIGNISTDPMQFIQFIFTVLLSMSGGWATYLIITAGYQLMFSHGEAEGVKEAQEKITSAVVGIVFMVLSLVILRVIGVDIFKLPTFG